MILAKSEYKIFYSYVKVDNDYHCNIYKLKVNHYENSKDTTTEYESLSHQILNEEQFKIFMKIVNDNTTAIQYLQHDKLNIFAKTKIQLSPNNKIKHVNQIKNYNKNNFYLDN